MIGDVVVIASFGYGVASATIPVLNAEAYAAAAAATLGAWESAGMVLALTVGTVVGKYVLFRAARTGREFHQRRPRHPSTRAPGRLRRGMRRVGTVLMSWLADPWRAVLTVVISSFVGIPPLLAVAVAAGASQMPTTAFVGAVFVGRGARFATIAGAAYGLI